MGQNAYNLVGEAYKPSKPNVFKELSKEFRNLSQILFTLQKKSEKQDSKYLLELSKQKIPEVFH